MNDLPPLPTLLSWCDIWRQRRIFFPRLQPWFRARFNAVSGVIDPPGVNIDGAEIISNLARNCGRSNLIGSARQTRFTLHLSNSLSFCLYCNICVYLQRIYVAPFASVMLCTADQRGGRQKKSVSEKERIHALATQVSITFLFSGT